METKEIKRESNNDTNHIISLDDSDNSTNNVEMLKLISNENEIILVEKDIAILSELIKTMHEGDKEEKEIPLPNVKSSILKKVILYLKYHFRNPAKEIEKPLKSANLADVVCPWDAEFIECDNNQETLFELILAANYMDIKPLLDLSCAKVASMIKGKTPEEIRKTFNITNDFTPEEENTLREENKWAEES
jgi:S-phase kinase-associated protein 1